MPVGSTSSSPPLSDDEYDALADFLEDHSPFDLDGVLGALHAVAVAPSVLPPSAWLPVVLPSDFAELDSKSVERFVGLLLRLHNDVLDAISHRQVIMPELDDVAGRESFAAGYAAAAAIDPLWFDNVDRWTFASHVAFLGGRLDLVPKETLAKIEAVPDARSTLLRDLGAIVAAAHDSFKKLRQAPLTQRPSTGSPMPRVRQPSPSVPRSVLLARVGRNAPCPCASGKKYKRCCMSRRGTTAG